MSHRTEVAIGAVVAALGLVGAGLAIFAPAVYTYGTNWLAAGSLSLWDAGITTNVGIFLAVMAAASIGIAVGAYLRSRELVDPGLALLWASAVVLFGGALLTLPGSTTAVVPNILHADTPDSVGIGVYLILPALAAIVCTFMETFAHAAPRRPAFWPH